MNKLFLSAFFALFSVLAIAQTNQTPIPTTQQYGKVDKSDLELTSCDFEKDANAEVLFNKAELYFDLEGSTITNEIHKRIKIFNDNGKKQANIHLTYWSGNRLEFITGLQAETINLTDGKIEITKLDKNLIFNKPVDKVISEISFSMPNVKAGSIIEFKYKWNTNSIVNMPSWDFQEEIPIRYTEWTTSIPDFFYFRANVHFIQPMVKHVNSTDARSFGIGNDATPYILENETRAFSNVRSLPEEPYMSSFKDNVQNIDYQLVSIKSVYGRTHSFSDTWAKVGGNLIDDDDFGGQLKRKLNNEDVIINKAKAMKTDDDKISYIFNEVKNTMKWNESDRWYTIDGTYRAWENKTGNSAEINLILYHLLKQTGFNVYPMVVSTRKHGRVRPFFTSLTQFNRAVVYLPLDSANRYILDATNKYNSYHLIPEELLNSSGLYVDKQKNLYDIIFIKNEAPAKKSIIIDAEIKPNSKIEGTAQIYTTNYFAQDNKERYKTDGDAKFIDYLKDGDNNLKISNLSFENLEVDTLPLSAKFTFNLDLTSSDENYIYVNGNLFGFLKTNPFLSESRATNVYYAYNKSFNINGSFKIPAGYKTDALPKNISLVMPDKSIIFKRFLAEDDGKVITRYNIIFLKNEYKKEDYQTFYEFSKKMYELLNEPIILKKL